MTYINVGNFSQRFQGWVICDDDKISQFRDRCYYYATTLIALQKIENTSPQQITNTINKKRVHSNANNNQKTKLGKQEDNATGITR